MTIKEVNFDSLNRVKLDLEIIKAIDKEVLVIIVKFCQQSELRKWIIGKSKSRFQS